MDRYHDQMDESKSKVLALASSLLGLGALSLTWFRFSDIVDRTGFAWHGWLQAGGLSWSESCVFWRRFCSRSEVPPPGPFSKPGFPLFLFCSLQT